MTSQSEIYPLTPVQGQIPICCIPVVRTFSSGGTPDLLVPLVFRDCVHFVSS